LIFFVQVRYRTLMIWEMAASNHKILFFHIRTQGKELGAHPKKQTSYVQYRSLFYYQSTISITHCYKSSIYSWLAIYLNCGFDVKFLRRYFNISPVLPLHFYSMVDFLKFLINIKIMAILWFLLSTKFLCEHSSSFVVISCSVDSDKQSSRWSSGPRPVKLCSNQ